MQQSLSDKDYRTMDMERKHGKVEKIVNRARACRTMEGLQRVGDDARSMGLWNAEDDRIVQEFSRCNARLRGRYVPARWIKDELEVVVSDDKVVGKPWLRTRQLSAEGWRYAGQIDG